MELSQVRLYQGVERRTQEQGAGLREWWGLKAEGTAIGEWMLLSHELCDGLFSVPIITANSALKNWDVEDGKECFLVWCSRSSKTVAFILFWIMTHSKEYLFSHKPVTYTIYETEAKFHGTVLTLTMQDTCWCFLFSSVSFEQNCWHLSRNQFLNPWKGHDLLSEKSVLSCTMCQQTECPQKPSFDSYKPQSTAWK